MRSRVLGRLIALAFSMAPSTWTPGAVRDWPPGWPPHAGPTSPALMPRTVC
jgi:hypothetical protein